jgi:hypothetical protein
LNEERVRTGKRARKNRDIDSDEEEDTAAAEIHEIHEAVEDVSESLRKVEESITKVEIKLEVVFRYKI